LEDLLVESLVLYVMDPAEVLLLEPVVEGVGIGQVLLLKAPPVAPLARVVLVPRVAPIHQQTVALSAVVTEPSMYPLLIPPLPMWPNCTTPMIRLLVPGS